LLVTLDMAEAFDAPAGWEQQYGALQTQRIEQQAGDATPRQKPARKRLLQSLNALVSFIAVNAQIDPAVFGAAAEQIAMVVKAANAVTRSGKTRRDNAAEAEQAEAHTGGQAQNAATPLQGTLVVSATPDTNPVSPPENKGASTA
jgi:hypothetical protein